MNIDLTAEQKDYAVFLPAVSGFFATFIGIIPGTLIYVWIGINLDYKYLTNDSRITSLSDLVLQLS